MQLFEYRISTDDSKIHDSCAGWCALRDQNHSQGVLLPGLPFYLEQSGRAHDWTPLASLLSRERIWDRRLVAKPISVAAIDSSHTIPFVMNPGLPWRLLVRPDCRIPLEVSTTFYQP